MIRRIAQAAALIACAAAPAAAQEQRPTLLVFVTVDQLRPDYFTRWGAQMDGGLRRLWDGGAAYSNAHQDHAVTETAPGHASTLSGRFPRGTGIVRNAEGVQDPQTPVLGNPGAERASPFRFRGSTLVDWLRVKSPESRALSVSRKDRGAIFPMGRANQDVFWYAYDGRFSTSTYYADTLPAWVRRFNDESDVRGKLAGRAWDLLRPASDYPEPDDVAPENSSGIAGDTRRVFPHRVPTDPDAAARTLTEFPLMDSLTLALAMRGMTELRLGARGDTVDVLAVSLSTTDAVGHRFGPDSREIHDQVLRLDRMLGAFLDSLFRVRDPRRVVLALTADHGATSFPEVKFGADADRYYIAPTPFNDWLGAELQRMGLARSAVTFDDGLLYVDRDAFAAAGQDPAELGRRFVDFARTVPGVLRADLPAELASAPESDAIARRWTHMLPPDLPIVATATLRPGYVWGTARYARHGSPHDDDTRVPVIFYGTPFRAGRSDRFVRVVDIAPTLARVLGIRPTEPIDGVVLEDALR